MTRCARDAGSRWARRRAECAARAAHLAVAAALTVSVSAALAQWREWDSDFDDGRKPWKEIETRIPSYPRSGDLIPFEAGAASPHRFYLDARSLSVGEDGVVRYTLVVKTAGGATNVTFEGIRCELRQQKIYAVGHPNGSWARARNPQWRRIDFQDANHHHHALYGEYLCSGRLPVQSERELLQRLKYGARSPAGG
ncbi:MAG: CNP1-like family protein [Burkholderiales bacterium]